jgi:uncharacterized damage-inducible protein DinB
MELKRYFAEQLDREVEASRKTLERVPEGRNSWKPHSKSMELGYLAALVAGMPRWLAMMIDFDDVDLNGNGKAFRTQAVETTAELLSILEKGAAESRQSLANTTDEYLLKSWRLTWGGQVLSDRPRYIAISDGALGHMAHHRGQLTVYLRLNDAPVPALYGPSADEGH